MEFKQKMSNDVPKIEIEKHALFAYQFWESNWYCRKFVCDFFPAGLLKMKKWFIF